MIVALVGVMAAAFALWGSRNRLSALLAAVLLIAAVLSFSFMGIPGISMRLWGEAGLSTSPALVAVVWGGAITTLAASLSARRSDRDSPAARLPP
jgi:predicted acyltransferase